MPELKQQTIERGQRILAMCNVLLFEMDEIEKDKVFFRHELKMTGKNFIRELEKQIKDLYDAMDEDAELYYNKQMTFFEGLVKGYINERSDYEEIIQLKF